MPGTQEYFPVLCLCHLKKVSLKGIYFPGQKVLTFDTILKGYVWLYKYMATHAHIYMHADGGQRSCCSTTYLVRWGLSVAGTHYFS